MPDWSRLVACLFAVGLGLAAICSCVPVHGGQTAYRVSVAIPDADRSLLRQLALADPLAKPVTATPAASPFAAPPPFLTSLDTDDGQRAEDCLTAAVYYEARSEPIDGQRAVAQVVLNRVRDRAFPASVCGVVYQHRANVCQFTFACDGSTAHPIQPRAWAIARAVADAALGGSVFAAVGSATHYHANYVSPWWAPSLTRVGAIGNHIFYRWHDRLADALSYRQAYTGREATPGGAMTIAASSGDTNGVHVVRGGDATEQAGGVTIHRGLGEAEAPEPTPVASGSAAFGVRVHRKSAEVADAPAPDADQH